MLKYLLDLINEDYVDFCNSGMNAGDYVEYIVRWQDAKRKVLEMINEEESYKVRQKFDVTVAKP